MLNDKTSPVQSSGDTSLEKSQCVTVSRPLQGLAPPQTPSGTARHRGCHEIPINLQRINQFIKQVNTRDNLI